MRKADRLASDSNVTRDELMTILPEDLPTEQVMT
jgi:hypothetical protein